VAEKLYLEDDPMVKEASGVKVVTEDGKALAYFRGPMSITAAGAFMKHYGEFTDTIVDNPYIRYAMENWRKTK